MIKAYISKAEELGTSERGSGTRNDWRLSQEVSNCCSVSSWGCLLTLGKRVEVLRWEAAKWPAAEKCTLLLLFRLKTTREVSLTSRDCQEIQFGER